MKKNRNSFFSESAMNYNQVNPNMGMPINAPFQSSTSYNSFYAGNPNINPNMPYLYNDTNELDSRLAKIERQINRLEHRISKLEANNTYINDDFDNSGNMYML